MKILTVGAIFVDIKGYPSGKFDPKGRNVGQLEYVHGGVMRNIAEDIASMGGQVSLASVLDDSPLSKDVIERLNKRNVETKYIRITPDGLGTWLAIFDDRGDVYSSISKRPVLLPIREVLKENEEEIFSSTDSIAVDISDEKEMLEDVFSYAKKYHIDVYAAVSNMTEAMNNTELFDVPACLVCNQQEAGILFHEDYEDKEPEELLEILKEKIADFGPKSLIVTMGAKGACYVTKDGQYGIEKACEAEVVDTTGAGDSFFAGITYALSMKKSFSEACRLASFVAAKTISTYDNVCPILTDVLR